MSDFVIQAGESDLSLRQQGFQVLSGSGEFKAETKTTVSGSVLYQAVWYELKAINSNAVVQAKSLIGDDLSVGGTYLTGSDVTITKDTSILGRFSKVTVTSGVVLAYKG